MYSTRGTHKTKTARSLTHESVPQEAKGAQPVLAARLDAGLAELLAQLLRDRRLFSATSRRRRRLGRGRPTAVPTTPGERLHRGEEQDVADRGVVGEEHGEPVDAAAPAARRREAVLQRDAEVLVLDHRLVVARRRIRSLRREALALDEGVVELGVRVAELLRRDEQLEALRDGRLGAVVLGQRRHDRGVLGDEGRRHALGFEQLANKVVDEPRHRVRRLARVDPRRGVDFE
mmetsp:Transcript_4793/g.19542  ORF Transcript_4793/g.19542 Transcript_4793/m.19542 type:complete len:232 (-) Transcript_4793:1362-2057(-)